MGPNPEGRHFGFTILRCLARWHYANIKKLLLWDSSLRTWGWDSALSPIVPMRLKVWTFFPLWWKIFHFEKFPKKNFLFQNHMNWNILQRWKFFHFWWKIFHFGEFFFRQLDLLVCQIWAQRCKVEIFPLWLKIFQFQVRKLGIFPQNPTTWMHIFWEKFFAETLSSCRPELINFPNFRISGKSGTFSTSSIWVEIWQTRRSRLRKKSSPNTKCRKLFTSEGCSNSCDFGILFFFCNFWKVGNFPPTRASLARAVF